MRSLHDLPSFPKLIQKPSLTPVIRLVLWKRNHSLIMILKKEHSPGSPWRMEECGKGWGQGDRQGPDGNGGGVHPKVRDAALTDHRPPSFSGELPASSVHILSLLSLNNKSSVDVPLTLQTLFRPAMCFAGWVLISAMVPFPLLAPLPSLTSSLWTPLPLPWDLFPVSRPHLWP